MSLNFSMPVLVVNRPSDDGVDRVDGAKADWLRAHRRCTQCRAALKKLKCKNYGLVISDDKMKPLGGQDLLREIRANPRTRCDTVPVADGRRAESSVSEPCAKIAKPFNAQMLHRRIETILAA